MKRSLVCFSGIFLCFVLSSCFSSSSSSLSTIKAVKVLGISRFGHVNAENLAGFSFAGTCSGLDGLTLQYSFQTVPGKNETAQVVEQGSVACSDGAWELIGFNITRLSDGEYRLTLEVEGATSVAEIFHKDVVIPEVTFEGLAARSKDDSVTLTGTCSESGTVGYDFLDGGGASLASGEAPCTYQDDSNRSWSVQVDVSGLGDGAMKVDVTLKDKVENSSVVVAHSFDRDTTGPALTLDDSPINSHNQGAYTLSGSCGEEGAVVSVSFHGSVLSGSVLCSGGAWEKTGINAQTIVTSGRDVEVILEHQDDLGNPSRLKKSVVRDLEAPTIVGSLGVPEANTYSRGFLDFSVTYSEEMAVKGRPRLSLTVGSSNLYANYHSLKENGTGVVFRYVILSGHRDIDDIEINAAIGLNGGSIKDKNGNEAPITLTLPSLVGIKVDGNVPSLDMVTGVSGVYKSGATVSLTAVFGQTVTVRGSPQLILNIGGSGQTAEYSDNRTLKKNHTFSYTVGSGDNDSDGIEVTRIDFNGGSIQNSLTPAAPVSENLGASLLVAGVKVDNTVPLITGLSNDVVGTKSKTWNWNCSDSSTPCEYRHKVNTNSSDSFQAGDAWGTTKTTSQTSGTQTYYLHIQAKDSVGNESEVKSFSSVLDNTGPLQQGEIGVPASKTYGLGEALSFQLSFDESVVVNTGSGIPRLVLDVGGSTKYAVYRRGSGSATLVFEFTVAEGDKDTDGLSGGTVLELNGGSLTDSPGNDILSSVLTGLRIENLLVVLVNGVPPVLSSVTAPPGSYTTGGTVDLRAVFNESVSVSMSAGGGNYPRLVLDVGGDTKHANYTGNGALNTAHIFRYTVSAGESDGNGIQVTGIDLRGGSLKNDIGNGVAALSSPLDLSQVLVDTAAPELTGLDNDLTAAKSKTWNWDCRDDSVPCEYRHKVNTSPSHSFQVGDTWGTSKTASLTSGTEMYYLHVQAKDRVGNESVVKSFSVILDNTGPLQQGDIVVPSSKTYLLGDILSFQLSFDEFVVVDTGGGTPRLALNVGGSTKHAVYKRGSGSATLIFEFMVATGDRDSDGLTGGTELDLNGGSLLDQAGNAVLSSTLTALNIQDPSGVYVDGVSSVLSSVTGGARVYVTGDAVDLTATFSGEVTLSASGGNYPRLVLDVGGSPKHAIYTGDGASNTAHVFRYTVSAGESDEDGIEITAIDLQGGTIQDASGQDSGALPSTLKVSGVLVDTVAPVLVGLANDPTATRSKSWTWTCTDNSTPCQYRYVVNTGNTHTFETAVTWGSAATTSQSTETGTYFLHVQAKDSVGNESAVQSVSVTLDNTSPLQQGSLRGPTAKTYKLGEALSFQLSFDESVVVNTGSGIPRLVLDVGGSTKYATYSAGSTTATLTFELTVAEGDEDDDSVSGATVLELNRGSLSDLPGNAVVSSVLGALSVADLSGVFVDGVRPVLTGLDNDSVETASKTWTWGCTDNSVPCKYRYVVNAGVSHTFLAGDTWGTTVTTSKSTETGTYYLHVQAKDSAGNESSVKSVSAVFDNDAASIVGVTLPGNKVYKEGDSMAFSVRYDDHVYVKAGASEARPALVLRINGVARNVEYTGTVYAQHGDVTVGALGTELGFSYTVVSGDEDADGITLSSLSNGQILDAFERAAQRTLPGDMDSSGIKVDAHRPSLTGLVSDLAPTTSKLWTWGCDDGFSCQYRHVVNTGVTHTFSSESWSSTGTARQDSGQGTYYLHVEARDENGLVSDSVHVSAILDAVAPEMTGAIEVPVDDTYRVGTFLDFALSYNEDVVVVGTPFLSLAIGSETRHAGYLESASTAGKVVFRYVVQDNDSDSDGIAWDGAIQLGASGSNSVGDSLGNTVALSGLTVPFLEGVKVDGALVALTSITLVSGWKKLGDVVTLTANFSGNAKITGSPHLTLEIGGSSVNAEFSGTVGSLASSHNFVYTVLEGHNDNDGIKVTAVVLEAGEKLENSVGTPVVFLGPFTFSDVKVDSGVPAQPTLSLDTSSPSEDSTPTFSVGGVVSGDRIKVYRSADCSGVTVGEKTGAFDPDSLTISAIATPGTYSFSGKVVDLASNESPCSSSVSYTFDAEAIQQAVEMGPNGEHVCALSSRGEVKCWGKNDHGQLGQGDRSHRGDYSGEMAALVAIDLGSDGSGVRFKAKQIAVGNLHSCAILSNDTLKCWGRNKKGQLGLGDSNDRGDGGGEMGNSLRAVNLGTNLTAKYIAGGGTHTCAILSNDTLKCWGINNYGQLGQGNGPLVILGQSPKSVNLGTDATGAALTVKHIALGGLHSCALLSDDTVKCWGGNGQGQLGLGDTNNRGDNWGEMGNSLPAVNLGTNLTAKYIGVGSHHSCAILNNNALKCWGGSIEGELGYGVGSPIGNGANEMGNHLGAVSLGSGLIAKKVTGGFRHTCALLSNDKVKCWGGNNFGQLGLGDTNDRGDNGGEMGNSLPAIDWGTGLLAKDIAAGFKVSCGFLSDDTVKCWGKNNFGQLGQGNTSTWGDNGSERAGDNLPQINLGSEFASFQLSSAVGTGGSYGLGKTVDLTVTFSKAVTLSNNGGSNYPRLLLDVGGSTSYASYAGNGALSEAHTFTYTVGVGENDEDGIQVTEVEVQGGHIRDAFGGGSIFLSAALDVSGVLVETVPPAITGLSDDTVPTKTKTWSWGCVDSATPCKYRYVVNTNLAHSFQAIEAWGTTSTATESAGTGTYYLHVQGRDGVGNELAVQSYSAILDNTSPQVVGGPEVPGNTTYRLARSLDFAVTYDEDVVVAGTPFLSLNVGSDSRNAEYIASESTDRKLVFRYVVQNGHRDDDGIAWDGVIQLGQGGSIGDTAGNAVTLSALTVPFLTGVLVDGVSIATSGVAATGGWYKSGASLTLTVSFNGAVTVTGSPHLTLDVGGTAVNAAFSGTPGSSASSHTFSYTVVDGHNDSDGIKVTALVSESGESIVDSGGANVLLHGPFVLSGVKIDTTVPGVPTLSFVTPNPGYDSTPDLSFDPSLVGDMIKLYKSTDCSGSVLVEGTVASNPGVLTVPDLGEDGSYGLSAKVVDLAANESACSSSVSYTLDKTWAKQVVDAGEFHTCAVSSNGALKCWGKNNEGQLGQDDTGHRGDASGEMGAELTAINLGTDVTVRQVSVGGRHSCALLSNDTVKCWGKNSDAQLGQDSTDHRGDASGEMAALAAIHLGSGLSAKQISAGDGHSCALLSDDKIKCWGRNNYGQLGQGDLNNRGGASGDMAALSAIDFGAGVRVKQVSAGGDHSCAILSNGKLKCWGRNNEGQLGLGDQYDRGDNAHEMVSLPAVNLGEGLSAKQVSAGRSHTCALLSNDRVKCWGKNGDGQLGQGDTENRGEASGDMAALAAVSLGANLSVKQVSAGERHTCALLSDHKLKCWGSGRHGRLGQGDSSHRGDEANEMGANLLAINLGTGLLGKQITAGWGHTCAFLSDETLKCWGHNGNGQLGQGNRNHLGDNSGNEMGNHLSAINLGSEFAVFQLSSVGGTGKVYSTGESVSLTATFSAAVTLSNNGGSNNPRLILDVGGSTSYATYTGDGALSAAHVFRYTVSAGDDDVDGIEVTGIDLRGGHIRNASGSGLSYSGPILKVSGVLVDGGIAPLITGLSDDTVATKSKTWSWSCTEVSTPCEYRYVANINVAHSFESSDLWGTTSTATESTGTGTYYLHIQAKDRSGNESDVEHFSALLDNTSPRLQGSIEVPTNNTYVDQGILEFALTYDEDVVVGGTPFLSLAVGNHSRSASYVGSASTARRLVFRYVVQGVDSDTNGIAWDGTIQLGQGGSLGDALGNAVTLTGLTVPSLGGVLVSGGVASVAGITAPDGWYKSGDEIIFTVNFSAAVTVTGAPHLRLRVGSTSVDVDFSGTAGSAASSHTFLYTVANGQNDGNGIDVTALVLDGAEAIEDSSGANAIFNHPFAFSGIKIDTVRPLGSYSLGWPGGNSVTHNPSSSHASPGVVFGGTPSGNDLLRLYQSNNCTGEVEVEKTVKAGDNYLTWYYSAYLPDPFNSAVTFDLSVSLVDRAGNVASQACSASTVIIRPPTGSSSRFNEMAAKSEVIPFATELESGQGIVVGGSHSCVLSSGGELKCWGNNGHGQLGLGGHDTIDLGMGLTAKQITAGQRHTCALLSHGKIKCWGNNGHGQLGLGDRRHRGEGALDMGMNLSAINLGADVTVKQVVAGGKHTCALLSSDKLKCWGSNDHGQLGLGDTSHRGDEGNEMGMNLSAINLGADLGVNQVVAGGKHTCAILSNGDLKCWGNNNHGQLGQGDSSHRGDRPGEMASLVAVDLGTDERGRTLRAKQMATGGEHTCVLLSDDKIKCWGRNNEGQLGLGDTNHRGDNAREMGDNLVVVDLGTGLTAKQITAGQRHTCALLSHHKLKCWGENIFGQLGQGDTRRRGDGAQEMGDHLAAIDFGTDESGAALTVKQITAGGSSPGENTRYSGSGRTCAILSNNTIKCWGRSTDSPVMETFSFGLKGLRSKIIRVDEN